MICFLFLLVEIIKVKIFFMEINVVFILKYLEFFVYLGIYMMFLMKNF